MSRSPPSAPSRATGPDWTALRDVLARARLELMAGDVERAEGLVSDAARLLPMASATDVEECAPLVEDLVRGFRACIET